MCASCGGFFKCGFCNSEIFLICFFGCWYLLFHKQCLPFKHLLPSICSARQLQLWLLEVCWLALQLWEVMNESMFLQQLFLNFIVFSVKILDFSWCFGEWRLINLKNFLPVFAFTFFKNGGLNDITFCWRWKTR